MMKQRKRGVAVAALFLFFLFVGPTISASSDMTTLSTAIMSKLEDIEGLLGQKDRQVEELESNITKLEAEALLLNADIEKLEAEIEEHETKVIGSLETINSYTDKGRVFHTWEELYEFLEKLPPGIWQKE